MSTPTPPSPPPKPITETWRPELVGLPARNPARRCFRSFVRGLMRFVARLCLKADVRGLENFPARGPALLVTNHLGDADAVLLLAALPAEIEAVGKIEMYDFPIVGKLMHWYGTIWVHRGRPDVRALRAALLGLQQGRMIVIAPEGRYSLIGGLEEGTDGAAFLAHKSDVALVPIAMTGTENRNVYGHLRRLRRARVTLTVGKPFRLADPADRASRLAESIHSDTQRIMESLARLLPPEYRGIYARRDEI